MGASGVQKTADNANVTPPSCQVQNITPTKKPLLTVL